MNIVVVRTVVCGIDVRGKLIRIPHLYEHGQQNSGDVETQMLFAVVGMHDVAEVAQNGMVFLKMRVGPVARVLYD